MDYAKYSEQLSRLGERYWQEGFQAIGDYARAVTDLSQGEHSTERLLQFAKTEGVGFAKRLYQCNVDYYAGLFNAGLGLSQQKTAAAAGQQPATTASPVRDETVTASPDTQSFHTELHFEGKQGDTLTEAFVIANNQPQAVEISFEVSEFVSADQHKVRLPVAITPTPVSLEQNQEQVMQCRIELGDELTPGQRYQAIARVLGYPDMMVRLILDIQI